MKTKHLYATFIGIALVATGCVETMSGSKTAGVPFIRDRFEGRYERSVDQVYQASQQIIADNGVLLTEYIPHGTSNVVRALEGKVNQRTVWIRVEGIDPNKPITAVTVQARTKGGGSDMELVHELEKQIALKLAR